MLIEVVHVSELVLAWDTRQKQDEQLSDCIRRVGKTVHDISRNVREVAGAGSPSDVADREVHRTGNDEKRFAERRVEVQRRSARTRMFDFDARPDLEEVLIVRRDRMARVMRYLAGSTEERLDREVVSPNGGKCSVRVCFHVVFKEEWWHDHYAVRDLTILERNRPTSG